MEQKIIYNDASGKARNPTHTGLLFCFLWTVLFVLYYPAAKAGFVTDFTGWLDQVKNHSFSEYINRTNFHVRSLYQFTQFNTYIFYKLFGVNAWAWHLLFISLHAINACLLFRFCKTALDDAGVENSKTISFAGALLFTVSPYISEVVVWEPSFHFLQGLLLILLILRWTQKYVHTGSTRYVWRAAAVYSLSLFSLEVFYLTPFLVFISGTFYRRRLVSGKSVFGSIVLYFFLPLLLLLVARIVGYRLLCGDWVSRIGANTVAVVQADSFGKPAKYLFHLLFLGRFLTPDTRKALYDFCDSALGIILFYSAVTAALLVFAVRHRIISEKGKVAGMLFACVIISLLLLVPLWFSDILLVLYDRYLYVTAAFFYMLFAVSVSFISLQWVRTCILLGFALINLRFAIQVSRYWAKSYRVDNALQTNFPAAGNKTVILLNLPESMHGIPMIGADKESEFKFMHNLLWPHQPINNAVYDAMSYNMVTPHDGAHVQVINDSTVKVTLNQWGTWWWFAGKGGNGYETADYRLNLKDPGHYYELTLKKPAQQYLLLYQVGDQWKAVDWSKKGEDQN